MHVRLIELTGLVAFIALCGMSWGALFSAGPLEAMCWTLLALPVAFYLADILTGMIHWVCDSFGSERTPLWGALLVGPFRRHHRDPLAITRISLVENLGASAIAGSLALLFIRPAPGDHGFLWHFWMWFLVFGVVSNLFHRWAHWPRRARPRWMVALQTHRLLLSPQAHLAHHRRPHRVNYCILSGWGNALTNRVPWERLEGWLSRLGIRTNFD